jgi:hypothetical protein
MAKDYNYYYKKTRILALLCLLPYALAAQTALDRAKLDIGLLEGKNNTGGIQKYAKYWNQNNPQQKLALTSPYCGLGINYWLQGKHGIKYAPRAISWQTDCKKGKAFYSLSINDLVNLPKGVVVVYRVKRKAGYGNHVGLFEKAILWDIYTIEANTSNARSIVKYSQRSEGVFRLKTNIHNNSIRPVYYCDCS